MASINPRMLGVIGLLVATSAWGSLFIVGKSALSHVNPVWFTLLRYTLATALFAALVVWQGASAWRKLRQHGPRLAAMGLVGYGFFSVLVLTGLAHSVPSHGAVIMATMPITTQLIRWLVDGIRPTWMVALCTLMALAGVVVVSGVLSHGGGAGQSTAMGDLMAFVGTLGWIAYTRGAAKFPTLSVLEYSALTAMASWPLLLAGALFGAATSLAEMPSMGDLAAAWPELLYIGTVPSIVAILAYNFGVRTLGVVTGTAFLNFVPVSAVIMGAAMGHPTTTPELAGLALVVGALLLHTVAQKRQAAPAAAPARHGPAIAVERAAC